MAAKLVCGDKTLDLTTPKIMGILNVTPDSFSDGGLFMQGEKALRHAEQMVQEGASIIDVGGESTRPGAQPVNAQQELDRVIPIIETLNRELPCIVSVDTSKPEVMREAVKAGAGMLNDVNALQANGAREVAAEAKVAICLMHMKGEPRTMQDAPQYEDVVQEVKEFLLTQAGLCQQAGVAKGQIIIDPGFGFGKTLAHNLLLTKHLEAFTGLDYPVLVGISRKSSIGILVDKPATDRLYGSLAFATLLINQGAKIIRVHDVGATLDVLKVCHALTTVES